jgi:hypothetical protein
MIRLLFYFDNHSFGLIYLLFRSPIPFDNEFGNYTRLKIRLNVLIFDLGFLSW